MKSLQESLLDRNTKLDAGGAIKSELVGNNRDWNNVDFRMDEHGVLHIDSTSWLLPQFKVEDMKLMKTLGVKSLQFHEGIRQAYIPIQRFVTNIQMNDHESIAYMENIKNASKMAGWTIQASVIEIHNAGRMAIEGNTFISNKKSTLKMPPHMEIRNARAWNWKDNQMVGIVQLNVFFKSGPNDFHELVKAGPAGFMGPSENFPELKEIIWFPYDFYRVDWNRTPGRTNEWKKS